MLKAVRFASIACVLVFGLVSPALAAPKDAQADKAYKAAMEEDYLDTKFDDAEKKLKKALDACGASACAPKVKAKLYMGLGIVLAGGREKVDEGADAFAKGLELDPDAEPDADYLKAEVRKAFDQAKKKKPSGDGGDGGSGGEDGGDGGEDGGDGGDGGAPITHTPPAEQRVNTPVPIFVGMDEATLKKALEAKLYFTPVDGGEQRQVSLDRSGKGYRGQIPCTATGSLGLIKYWIVIKDKKGKVIGNVGTDVKPNQTEIKNALDGKPPSWPGFPPPDACGASLEELREKSSLRQCIDTADCPQNEACNNNECVLRPDVKDDGSSSSADDDDDEVRRNWFTLTFAPDFSIVSGDDVCSPTGQQEQHFYCSRPAGTAGVADATRYVGTPTAGQGNNVNTGFAVSTMRLMLGYDRIIAQNFGIGARIGFAFNGTSVAEASFMPVHVEGRVTYAIGENPYGTTGVRPWFAISGGLAQIDSSLDVQVIEDGKPSSEGGCGAPDPSDTQSACEEGYTKAGGETGRERLQTLSAAKQAGLGFAGGTVGVSFMPVSLFAINTAVRFNVTFPVVVPVLSPELGISLGF